MAVNIAVLADPVAPGRTTPPDEPKRLGHFLALPGQPAERAALTTIVFANLSWKPCLVGLLYVVQSR
jgi:hypothetical protein